MDPDYLYRILIVKRDRTHRVPSLAPNVPFINDGTRLR